VSTVDGGKIGEEQGKEDDEMRGKKRENMRRT
jgi:hypothetical protein